MSSGLITTYLGEGLTASRPATPDVGSGAIAFWYSTDDAELSAYVDGAWVEDILSGGGGIAALDDIPDVDVPTPSDGDVLTFDSGSGDWIASPAAGGISSGTSFPGSPSSGDLFFRTDRNIVYFYNGTNWLSTFLLSIDMIHAGSSITANTNFFINVPYRGTYSIWLERLDCAMLRSGAGEFDIVLTWQNSANSPTTITTLDGAGDTSATWVNHSATIDSVLDSNARAFVLSVNEISGTSNVFASASLFYRLVG